MKIYLFILGLLLLFANPVQAWQIDYNSVNFVSQRGYNNYFYNNNASPMILTIWLGDYCDYGIRDFDNRIYVNDTLAAYLGTVYVSNSITDQTNILSVIIPAGGSYRLFDYSQCFSGNTDKYIAGWYEWNTTDTSTQEETNMMNELLTVVMICLLFIVIYILYKEIVR